MKARARLNSMTSLRVLKTGPLHSIKTERIISSLILRKITIDLLVMRFAKRSNRNKRKVAWK